MNISRDVFGRTFMPKASQLVVNSKWDTFSFLSTVRFAEAVTERNFFFRRFFAKSPLLLKIGKSNRPLDGEHISFLLNFGTLFCQFAYLVLNYSTKEKIY